MRCHDSTIGSLVHTNCDSIELGTSAKSAPHFSMSPVGFDWGRDYSDVGIFWLGANEVVTLPNEPGHLYSHGRDILDHYLPENSGAQDNHAYENGLRRVIRNQITETLLHRNNPVQAHPETRAFAEDVEHLYSTEFNGKGSPLRQQVWPYDLSEGEAFPVLSAKQGQGYKGMYRLYDFLLQCEAGLNSKDLNQNLEAVVSILEKDTSEMTDEKQATLKVLDELMTLAEKHPHNVQVAEQAFQKLGEQKWNGRFIFAELRRLYQEQVQEFKVKSQEFSHQAELLRGQHRHLLPKGLHYHRYVPFDDQRSQELYRVIVTDQTRTVRQDQAYQLGEVSGVLSVTVVESAVDSTGSADDSARLIEEYRTMVLPEVARAFSNVQLLGSLAGVTAFEFPEDKPVATPPSGATSSQWVLANPDRLREKLSHFDQTVDGVQTEKLLREYGSFNHPQWQVFVSDIKEGLTHENLQEYYDELELTSQTDQELFQEAVLEVYLAALKYSVGQSDLNAFNAQLAELYLQSVDLQREWQNGTQIKNRPEQMKQKAQVVWNSILEDLLETWVDQENHPELYAELDDQTRHRCDELQSYAATLINDNTRDDLIPVLAELDRIDDVLLYAQERTKLPKDLVVALQQSASYQKFESNLRLVAGNFELAQDYMYHRVSADTWVQAVKKSYPLGSSVNELENIVQKLTASQKVLEEQAHVEFHPYVEVDVVNRSRQIVFALDAQSRVLKKFKEDQSQDFSLVVQRDLEKWKHQLPAGYPKLDGSSSAFGYKLDDRFYPEQKYYLSLNDLGEILAAQDSYNGFTGDEKLYDFLTNLEGGYFPYFSLNYEISNEAGITWVSNRDFNALTELLVLINYWESLLANKAELNASETKSLDRLQKLRTKIRQAVHGQNIFDRWVVTERNQVTRVVPSEYYKRVPASQVNDLDEERREAYLMIHGFYSHPANLILDALNDRQVLSLVDDMGDSVMAPGQNVYDLEGALQSLPTEIDYSSSLFLIDGFDAVTAAYFYGRLLDRQSALSASHDQVDYQNIIRALEQFDISDLRRMEQYLASSESEEGSLPAGLSAKAYASWNSIDLTDSQKLWVWGYCRKRVLTDLRQESQVSSDEMYMEYQGRDVLEKALAQTKLHPEYESQWVRQLNQLQRLQGEKFYSKKGFRKFSSHKQIALINQAYSDLGLNRYARIQTQRFQKIETSARGYIFKSVAEKHYGLAYIQFIKASGEEKAQLKEDLKPLAHKVGISRAMDLKGSIDSMSEEDRIRLVVFTHDQMVVDYKVEMNHWLKGQFPDHVDLQAYWAFMVDVIEKPESYILADDSVDVEALVRGFDQAIAQTGVNEEFEFDKKWQLVIESSVQHLEKKLMAHKRDTKVGQSLQVLKKIPQVSFYSFDESDPEEVKVHSQYNPNGFSIPAAPLASYDLDDLCDRTFHDQVQSWKGEIDLIGEAKVSHIVRTYMNLRATLLSMPDAQSFYFGTITLIPNPDYGFVFEKPGLRVAASFDDPQALELAKEVFAQIQPGLKHFKGKGLFKYDVSEITGEEAMVAIKSLMSKPRERDMAVNYVQHLSLGLQNEEAVKYAAENFHYFKAAALIIQKERPERVDLSRNDLNWALNGLHSLLREKAGEFSGVKVAQLNHKGEQDG